jgi:hypothetical protein
MGPGTTAVSTGRLSTAPDDHSDVVAADKTTWNGPAVVQMLQTSGAGPGRHSTSTKVPTMAKRTRGPDPVDRVTRDSGVTITPLARTVPVPTTRTVA